MSYQPVSKPARSALAVAALVVTLIGGLALDGLANHYHVAQTSQQALAAPTSQPA